MIHQICHYCSWIGFNKKWQSSNSIYRLSWIAYSVHQSEVLILNVEAKNLFEKNVIVKFHCKLRLRRVKSLTLTVSEHRVPFSSVPPAYKVDNCLPVELNVIDLLLSNNFEFPLEKTKEEKNDQTSRNSNYIIS